MNRVFITRKIDKIALEILSGKFEVCSNPDNTKYPGEKLEDIICEFDAILAMPDDIFSGEILSGENRVKLISVYSAGKENIDIEFAAQKGITVCNIPDIVSNSTADHTFALLLALNRKIIGSMDFIRKNQWKNWDPEIFNGFDLYNKKLGIIGFGRIGQAVARRALGFGMKISYFDKYIVSVNEELKDKVHRSELGILLENSDVITLHLPLTSETKYLFDRALFEKMTNKPFFLNLSRGKTVVTAGLIYALENGMIRGAALDVTDPEPLPGDHPLLGFQNCLITPHTGTATFETRYNMAKAAAENILKHFYPNE